MPNTTHTPRFRWTSPHDWLGDKINDALALALAPLKPGSDAFAAVNDIAVIANTIVNGTLAVDSDTIQDAFQDEMDEAGYFVDLDKPVYVYYEMEPIGVDGALEAGGIVHFFCSEKCREKFTDADVTLQSGEFTAGSPEVERTTQCEECGSEVA